MIRDNASGNKGTSPKAALCVFVRVRPFNEAERQRRAFECVSVVDNKRLLLVDPDKFAADALRQNRAQEREFRFDAVVGPSAGEEEVQSLLGAEGLVDQLVRLGHNGTVLAYGPTGTGKTHTMVGTRERPGLMTRMTRALYERLAEMGDRQTRVFISFMELYNELIRDLLKAERNGPLELLEDEGGNVHVPSLSRVRASNTAKLLQLLQEGNSRRTQEPTAANATSSRSHALLMISLWRGERQCGKLFLIDLAGSERAAHTENQGQRLKEGAAINRSLLALGNVINALTASDGRKPNFVNYRDSKLTRLLKDSLGNAGDNGARTVLIAHISPSSTHYNETFNTLTYASRAKNINYRLAQPARRPASADRSYSEALATLRHEAERAGRLEGTAAGVGHSSSTGQLSEETDSSTRSIAGGAHRARRSPQPANRRRGAVVAQRRPSPSPPPPGGIPPLDIVHSPARPRRPQQNTSGSVQQQKLPRLGASLFDSLRDQHLGNSERQQRLRERLLNANTEFYELEMARQARLTLLEAYEAQSVDELKFEKVAERVRKELAEQEARLSELAETRHKLERALRRGDQALLQLETRMRGMAKDQQQLQVVELVHSLARQQAERTAIQSDFALQGKRVRRQDSQLRRMRQFERVADRLIGGDDLLDEDERTQLRREYRLLRSRLDRMGPAGNALPSWNAQLVGGSGGGRAAAEQHQPTRRRSDDDWLYGGNVDMGKTFTVLRPRGQQQQQQRAARHRLPEVASTAMLEEEGTMSDAGENHVPLREEEPRNGRDGSLPPL